MKTPKMQRFRENSRLENVYEYTDFTNPATGLSGKWNRIFNNSDPLVLELACGRGEYALSLAKKYPDKNFVGIDIKGARIWKGATGALKESVRNIRFIRMYIDHLDHYFDKNEVNEIWITFPDPYPRTRQAKKRLTSPRFMDLYRHVLKNRGNIHLKTDSQELCEYTRNVLAARGGTVQQYVENIYQTSSDDPILTIRTAFERKHLKRGKTISYLRFQLPKNGAAENESDS